MFIKTCATAVAVGLFVLASSAFAQKSTIEGETLGFDNKPLKNAEVRVQQENSKSPAKLARTDAKGHFVVNGLAAGSYRVALFVNGRETSVANHIRPEANEMVRLKAAPTTVAAAAPKKRAVYAHPPTGSHLGGGYDRDESDTPKTDTMSKRDMERIQTRVQPGGGN